MKRPAFQFYPADWRKDSSLQSCSISARGLWLEMICIMHECEPYGHLAVNGKPLDCAKLARLVGEPPDIVKKLLVELEEAGVFSRTEDGCVFSRRMVKDERLRNVRAEAGRLGGNPNLVKQKDNQQPNQTANQDHNHEDKHRENHDAKQSPTPSSSSSSSLKTPPIPPKGGATPKRAKRESAVALKTFLAECKEKQEKPIPDEDSVFDYAEQAGIPSDFLRLHWKEFLARYNTPDAKRYKRWRDVFRKSVRGNWFRLWYVDSGGQYVLTTVGVQAQNAHKPREAA